MDTPTQRKRQLQVDEKQRKKQATRGQSVAVEVRIPPLPSSDSRVNPDSLDSFLSHHDADNRFPKIHTSSDSVAAPSTIPQCQICQRVARALHPDSGYRVPRHYDSNGGRFIKVGSWQEILRNRTCSTCSRVAELFVIKFQCHGGIPRSAKYEFWLFDNAFTRVILQLKSKSHRREVGFDILPLPRGISEPVGVLMDRCWIDSERVLEWIKSCDTMHAECHCNISVSGASFSNRNMYLISVSRKCLVKANSGEKYVALSYVWGASCSQFRTTKANLNFLQSEGSLCEGRRRDNIPGTIQRAMHFTSLLDVDFLWVDCLCIVQDDPIHAASQINSMASIYSNSYLTLCAADGIDAESGLLGIRQCSPPRNVQQDILAFADGPKSFKWVKFMPDKVSVYDERGWTFQEQVLSRRSLSFTENGLVWRCREVNAKEQALKITPSAFNVLNGRIIRADILWPFVRKLDILLYSYLKRRLTYDEDTLRAFSGILELFSSSMLGGFFSGLPQLFFDAALLWIPVGHLTRSEGVKSGIVKNALPSWSWAGWKGARRTQMTAFGLGHERSYAPFYYKPRMGDRMRDINPCVTWFKIDRDTGEKVRIPNDYSRFRDDGLNGTITLPLGWSSHQDDEDGSPYYYRYDKTPHLYTFWYPIPTLRGIQPASNRQWAPILYCKTMRGYLEMGIRVPQQVKEDDLIYHIYPLHTSEGTWAGIIYVHHSPESASEQNRQFELVLISGGWAFENDEKQRVWIPEWDHEQRPRSGDYYNFYHVLWIEWQDNIAYPLSG